MYNSLSEHELQKILSEHEEWSERLVERLLKEEFLTSANTLPSERRGDMAIHISKKKNDGAQEFLAWDLTPGDVVEGEMVNSHPPIQGLFLRTCYSIVYLDNPSQPWGIVEIGGPKFHGRLVDLEITVLPRD